MTSTILRRLGVGVTSLAVVGAAVAAAAPSAAAAPLTFTGRQVAVGDLTGDGIADRISLGSVHKTSGDVCAVQITAGLGHGRFGGPIVRGLPIKDTLAPGDTENCPDLGVVVKGPTPSQNQLAVAWFEFAPAGGGPLLQVFGDFAAGTATFTGSADGEYQPGGIFTQDFDGDGWGDLWEQTDQGSGFTAFLGRHGSSWHTLYQTPFTSGADPQFFDFNRAGGTDILVTWSEFGDGSGAAVVDGKTGAVQTLASATSDTFTSFDASVVDIDHNAYPDIQVVASPSEGPTVVHRYLNRSQGGRWYFQPLPAA